MTVVVFCGPTISADLIARELDAIVRPPARRGDLLHAALDRPHAIVLIDGYFDRTPAVWHKEILWAMSEGIHVFGSSSMGALRAAELAAFGMVGVGEIFEAFASGEIEDDDEVAVAHGDAESGYRLGSEAMVNIRATLRAAEAQRVISASTRRVLEARAKGLPYHQRHLQHALMDDGAVGPSAEISALREWLPRGRIDQKLIDATSLVRRVAALAREGWRPFRSDYHLARTDGWMTLVDKVESRWRTQSGSIDPRLEDELLARGLLGRTLVAATMRVLAAKRLRQGGMELSSSAVDAAVDAFRQERNLLTAESFETWIRETHLSESDLAEFFRRDAGVRATLAELRRSLGSAAEDELRAGGVLAEIRSMAERKAATLERYDMSAPTLQDAGLNESALWAWHFQERLGTEVPPSLDHYATSQAATLDDLRRSVLRHYMFETLQGKAPTGPG